MEKDYLVLKRASANRPSGEWNEDDFDVLADGAVVGRIFKATASVSDAASARMRAAMPDREERDSYLLGAAALAVAAAVGIALQRRAQQEWAVPG
jgi:hypothetical protein